MGMSLLSDGWSHRASACRIDLCGVPDGHLIRRRASPSADIRRQESDVIPHATLRFAEVFAWPIRRASRYRMPASSSPQFPSGRPSPHRRAVRRAWAGRPAWAWAGSSARRQRRPVPARHRRGLAPGADRPQRPALPVRVRRIRPSRREPQWERAVQSGSARHLRPGPFGAALPPRCLPETTAPRPSASITITRSERTLPTP
jgi:hypothetical protein